MYLNNIKGGNNAITRIDNICNDLKNCTNLIITINNGTYADGQGPIEFNMDTVPDLAEYMESLKDRVNDLYKAVTAPISVIKDADAEPEAVSIESVTADTEPEAVNSDDEKQELEISNESATEDPEQTSDINADKSLDKETYESIKNAKSVLCAYCGEENIDECDNCKVLKLMNTADSSVLS